jgi:hypothetical protein
MSNEQIETVSQMAPELSEEAIERLRDLLTMHYVVGGLPESLVAEVEVALKSVGRWFRDPQLLYDPEPDESYL